MDEIGKRENKKNDKAPFQKLSQEGLSLRIKWKKVIFRFYIKIDRDENDKFRLEGGRRGKK